MHRLYACAVNLKKWQYNLETVQSHDVAPSLYSTAISIDSSHIRKDGANYLNLPFLFKYCLNFFQNQHVETDFMEDVKRIAHSPCEF